MSDWLIIIVRKPEDNTSFEDVEGLVAGVGLHVKTILDLPWAPASGADMNILDLVLGRQCVLYPETF